MAWWQVLLFGLSTYCAGIAYGRSNPVDDKSQNQIVKLEDKADILKEEIDKMRILWLDAEQKAETWKRRYTSLLPKEKDMADE